MQVVLDTNILLSALIAQSGTTGTIVQAWRRKVFSVLTCETQIAELRDCFSRPHLVPDRISRRDAGQLINHLRYFGTFIAPLPNVMRSPDPQDDFLLALAEAGRADYLVTGDKAGLLSLRSHRGTPIVTARVFADRLQG